MSFQESPGTLFEICNEQQGLRFLELPPALLEVIVSREPPNLCLKSSLPGNDPRQQSSNAVLCTDKSTYSVRQVHSSNSVFVALPSEAHHSHSEEIVSAKSLSAIAECAATLELLPSSPCCIAILRERLPLYVGKEMAGIDAAGSEEQDSETESSKSTIRENAPFSVQEFESAWRALCAFELQGKSFRPTTLSLVSIWRSIMSVAELRKIDLGRSFCLDAVMEAANEDGQPLSLLKAVLARLGQEDICLMDNYAALNRHLCIPWVGEILLGSQQQSSGAVQLKDFMRDWRDLLPEHWREDAQLTLLKGKYSKPSDTTLEFLDTTGNSQLQSNKLPTADGGKGSRRWHEKFSGARR